MRAAVFETIRALMACGRPEDDLGASPPLGEVGVKGKGEKCHTRELGSDSPMSHSTNNNHSHSRATRCRKNETKVEYVTLRSVVG